MAAAEGYKQSKFTPGIWSYKWHPIQLSLVVDDSGMNYVGEEYEKHLVSVLKERYEMTTDWEGSKCCGLTLEYDYEK